jgi:hypothetical protein
MRVLCPRAVFFFWGGGFLAVGNVTVEVYNLISNATYSLYVTAANTQVCAYGMRALA